MHTEKHTFHQIFERIAQQFPNNNALAYTNEKNELNNILYSQLNDKANQLAHYFLEQGIAKAKKIAIFVNEIRFFIICILAVHKAGAIYIPISLYENNNVITDILEKSQPDACIFPKEIPQISEIIHKQLPSASIINLEEIEIILAEKNTCNPVTSDKVQMEDDAYIMFTSGTSGKPKGAILKHAGLPVCFRAHQEIFGISPHDRILQLAKVGFDASLMEIMMALGSGASLYIGSSIIRDNDKNLRDFLMTNSISIAIFVPSKLQALAKQIPHPSQLSDLRGIVVTGEKFTKEIIEPWTVQDKATNKLRIIVNGYGLTETTICISLGKFNGNDLTIGKPISSIKAHLLAITDEVTQNLTHLTPEIRGNDAELYVSGNSITSGYINDPENTNKLLVKITDYDTKEIITAFRTRDCVKYAPPDSDELIYVRRLDNQIKLRGQRLDPEHIEAQIKQFCINLAPVIKDARVVCIEQNGHKHLVAYLIPNSVENHPNVQEIHQHLKTILPTFMVPNAMQWIQQFPLTGNGKSARQALMQIRPIPFIRSQNELPVSNDAENKLAEIWKNLLRINNYDIQRDDDFFCLGGSSILISDLLTQIRSQQHYFPFSENCTAEQIYVFSALKMMTKSLTQTPLRKLHEGDHKQIPIIFVHSLLGDGWTEYQKLYEGLIKKFPDHSIFALRGNIGTIQNYLDTLESLEELSSFYTNIINLLLKVNNIILIGWSSGGLIAFAMAKHLQNLNISTHLFLLDSDTPDQMTDNALSAEYFANIRLILATKERSVQQFAEWLLAAEIQYARNITKNNKIKCNIYSFDAESCHKWIDYTSGECRNHTVQTNHFNIINDLNCLDKICDEIKKIKSFKSISQTIAAIKSHYTIPIKMQYLLDRSKFWELHTTSHIPLNLINAEQKYISIRFKFDEALYKVRDLMQKENFAWIRDKKTISIAGVSDDECNSWCTVISEDLKKVGFQTKKKYHQPQSKEILSSTKHEQVYISVRSLESPMGNTSLSYQIIIYKLPPEIDKDYIAFNTKNYYTSMLTLLSKLLSSLGAHEFKDCISDHLQLIDELRIDLRNNHEILLPDDPLSFYKSILNYETHNPEKILIEGSAGSGKTLLLKFLAQQWALGTFWKNRFDCVIHLFARNFLEECKLNNATEFTLAHAIYYRYFGYSINEKRLASIQLLLDSHCKMLLLLDGLEEIESAFLFNPRLRRLANEISSQRFALVTARPDRPSAVVFKHTIKNLGFSAGAINRYIETYFQDNPIEGTELEQCTETHIALREICHIPITLELICSLWKKDKEFFRTENVTITNIYQKIYSELIDYHWQINLDRIVDNNIQSKFPHIKQAVIQCIEKAAFINASHDNSVIISGKIWHQAYTEISAENDKELDMHIASARFNPGLSATFNLLKLANNPWFIYIHNSGLLNQVIAGQDLKNISYEFIHSRFQDFATASYLAFCIESQCKQQVHKYMEEFLQKHLYSLRYEHIWVFLSGLLKSNESKNWFFKNFDKIPNSQTLLERLAFKLKCINESNLNNDAPFKKDAVTQFNLILLNALKENDGSSLIVACRKILLHSPFLLNQALIIITITETLDLPKTKYLINCLPQLQSKILKEQMLQRILNNSDINKNKYNILIIGKMSAGKSSFVNTFYSALSNTSNYKESLASPETSQVTQLSVRLYDTWGWSPTSEDQSKYFENVLRGIQPSINHNDLKSNLAVIQHPVAKMRAKAVMRLNDAKILSAAATKFLMAVAFGDINYGVRDLAISILERRSLRSQYLSLLSAFDVLLKMNLPTQFWVNFFEAKPEYLQYYIAHAEHEYNFDKEAKFSRLLFEAAHHSIHVYKSISYLESRFKMASELIKSLAKDSSFVEQTRLLQADKKLKALVNTKIFEHAIEKIHAPSFLPGPAYSDNPNTFFHTTKSQAKKNKALQDNKQKEKINTNFINKYGNKGMIFQP